MCTFIINKLECQFPAIQFAELEAYSAEMFLYKGIPYTAYYLAFRAFRPEDNIFLYNLIGQLEKHGYITGLHVFEGNIYETEKAGRSIMVMGSCLPNAEAEIRFWLRELCGPNYAMFQPYWEAKGIESAVQHLGERREL